MNDMPDWIADLFAALDAEDVPRWLDTMTDDATFRWGSLPPVMGRAAIEEFVDGFLGSIRSFRHRLLNVWTPPGAAICQGEVSYTMHDGREVAVPFTNVFHLRDGKIREYLVYLDPTPMSA